MHYLRTRRVGTAKDAFVIFPKEIDHLQMARSLRISPQDIVSGGGVSVTMRGPECFAMSMGLSIPSLPEDTMLLREQWNAPKMASFHTTS